MKFDWILLFNMCCRKIFIGGLARERLLLVSFFVMFQFTNESFFFFLFFRTKRVFVLLAIFVYAAQFIKHFGEYGEITDSVIIKDFKTKKIFGGGIPAVVITLDWDSGGDLKCFLYKNINISK